jgi:hypothetical protein
MVVGKILPDISSLRVILPHGAPLPLRQIRAPALPVLDPPFIFGQPIGFSSGHRALPA